MPIFRGDAQRWHNPFELYVTCPKLAVEAGTGLVSSRGGNWLDRYRHANFLSKKEKFKETPKRKYCRDLRDNARNNRRL
jgi:hypothetical protein